MWSKAEAENWISEKICQTEYGDVTQTVNGDGHHQALFLLIGDCKHDSADNLGERKVASVVMRQDKERGADQDGRIETPPSKKPEDDTSEKYLFPDRPDDTTHKIE
jgi:hypothetical protein